MSNYSKKISELVSTGKVPESAVLPVALAGQTNETYRVSLNDVRANLLFENAYSSIADGISNTVKDEIFYVFTDDTRHYVAAFVNVNGASATALYKNGTAVIYGTGKLIGGGQFGAYTSYVSYVYNNGSAVGGETEIGIPFDCFDIGEMFLNGSHQIKGTNYTFDNETNKVKLAGPLTAGATVVLYTRPYPGTPVTPVEPGITDYVNVSWLYNDGAAVGGETTLTPPWSFKTVTAIYINGSRQILNKHFEVVNSTTISLAKALSKNDIVEVILGGSRAEITVSVSGTPAEVLSTLALSTGATKVNTSYGVSLEQLAQGFYGVESFAALQGRRPAFEGERVQLKGYYSSDTSGSGTFIGHLGTGIDDGGIIAAGSGFYWERVIHDNTVTAEMFGCKTTETVSSNFNVWPTVRFDNTERMQAAFDAAISRKLKLTLSTNTYYFESANTLKISGTIQLEGRPGTTFYCNPSLKANPKTDPFIVISGCSRGRISSILCMSNSYLGKGIQIDRSVGDNQKMLLDNVFVETFRWGFYVPAAECLNQTEFRSCRAQSNYFAGTWIESFKDGEAYAHSAPVHFMNMINNGNGPTSFAMGSTYVTTTGARIAVMDTATDVGVQVYMKGLSNVQYIGGQVSGHGSPRNTALFVASQCNSVQLYGTDIEDITGYTTTGVAITADNVATIESTFANDLSGAAIVISAVPDFSIDSPHIFNIKTLATVKVTNNTYNYNIGGFTPGAPYLYDVWDTNGGSNSRVSGIIHPRLVNSSRGINGIAFDNMANKSTVSSLIHNEITSVKGIAPNTGVNVPHSTVMWQNGTMQSSTDLNTGYRLSYLSSHNQPLTSLHLYNEVAVSNFGASTTLAAALDELKYIYIQAPYANYGDGRVIIQAIGDADTILNSNWFSPMQFSSSFPLGGFVRFEVPTGTKKIRYGIVNSADYIGSLKSHFMANFAYSIRFFLKVFAVYNDIGRYGQYDPPYSVGIDKFRVGEPTSQMSAIADSTATDVAGVNLKLNALLAELRSKKYMGT